jgi:DNA modification methylase
MWEKMDRLALGHREWPRHCYEEILWFSRTSKPFCDPWAAGTSSKRIGANNYGHSAWTPGKTPRSGIARVTDVIVAPVGGNEKGIDHPAQFPMALVEPLIKTFCPPGGTVLDPFAGSGTTLLAAANHGRQWYGFEIDGQYCERTRQRIDKKRAG